MQPFRPFFSFAGRMNRQRYWVTSVLIYFAILAAGLTAASLPVVGVAVMIPGVIIALWVGLAAGVRRLHDRNKSAWWLLLFYGPSLFFSVLSEVASTSSPEAGSALAALSLPFSIWAFVELGCLKGTSGPNRFGEDPLGGSPAEVFS